MIRTSDGRDWTSSETAELHNRTRALEIAAGSPGTPATDAARELAIAEGVYLPDVTPTGASGQVTKGDVEAYLAG